jgi:hypothetical protein
MEIHRKNIEVLEICYDKGQYGWWWWFIPVAPTWSIGIHETLVSLQFLNLRQSVGLLG